jgi:hypothetical protein
MAAAVVAQSIQAAAAAVQGLRVEAAARRLVGPVVTLVP